MKVVFDLDDTICVHKKRDFDNALPVRETVEKIRALKQMGVRIIIYTARGQNSCHGDIELIREKYHDKIVAWLLENNVPFDELIFGKPLGDLYVDDKGVSLKDFYDMKIEKMHGKSGSEVFMCGDVVNKKCKNSWEQFDWYESAASYGVNVPRVYSVVLDNIEMEYINGKIKVFDVTTLNKILSNIFWFKQIRDDSKFDIDDLIDRVNEHLDSVDNHYDFDNLKRFLKSKKEFFRANASFSHGDFSISNCLVRDGILYLIDPNQNKKYSSYLLDLAKLKFSLNGGEEFLNNDLRIENDARNHFDKILENNNLTSVVTALEATHWIRLLKYEKDMKKKYLIIEKAKRLESEL